MVNGVRLAYDRVGHGFPILLVHGFPRRRGSPLMSGFLPKTPAARHGHQDEQQQSSAERGGDGRAPDLSDQAGRQRAETPSAAAEISSQRIGARGEPTDSATPAPIVPIAGIVSSRPRPSGPTWNTSRANTGINCVYDRPRRLSAAATNSRNLTR